MFEEGAMLLGTVADVYAHVLDINGNKDDFKKITRYGSCL